MSTLLPLINDAAAKWFPYVWHVTWQASLLAVLLLVVVRLGRRWPSPLRYALLVMALVKFALPPQLPMPTGLFSRMGPTVRGVSAETNVSTVVLSYPRLMDPPTPLAEIPSGPLRHDPESKRATTSTAPQPVSTTLDGKSWLMLLHVIGFLASGLWLLHGLLTMRRTIRRATEVPDGELRRRFIHLSERLGLRRPPRLLLSHEPFGPAAFGVLRPVVIIPSIVAQLEPSALDAVLAHELAHHRRRDPWINWVQLGLSVAWWFNPVVWSLNRQVRGIREDCCDDLLLMHNLTTGPAYCDTLLEAASRLTGRATASVSMMFGAHFHPLGRRLERIMDRTLRRAPRLSLAGMLSLAVLASVALPGLRRTEGDEPTPLARSVEPAAPKAAATQSWPEGAKIQGRVLDHRGAPIADAEVLLLGEERIIVDADRGNWFVINRGAPNPSSTRTDRNGSFTIARKQGPANRLAVIAKDPLFWVVPRSGLQHVDNVEVKLPPSGRLVIRSDFPNKPPKLPVMIELKSWDGSAWDVDSLRFHMSTYSLVNPGETVFEHMPPGHYTVQRFEETKTSGNSILMSGADRRLVQIEPAKPAQLSLERKLGRPLIGQVRGLEGVELREAHLTISQEGPEEVLGPDGRRNRMIVTFDVIPITSQGRFTIDAIPSGKYSASLFAVRASTPRLSSQSSDYSAGSEFTVPEQGDIPKVEFVAKANKPPDLSKSTDLRLRVVDESGTPVPRMDAMIHTADAGYGRWVSGRDGMVFLGGEGEFREAQALDVHVRADGFVPGVARFVGPQQREELSRGRATITLRRGRKVQVNFRLPEGMTWPKGVLPEVYFDDMQERVRMMRQPSNRRGEVVSDFDMLRLVEVGSGRFEFRLAEDTPQFHIAIHTSGFLQFFEAGPFSLADVKGENLEIDVPRPAELNVSFEPGDPPGGGTPFKGVSLQVLRQLQGNSYLEVSSTSETSLTPSLKLTDLAPGNYLVSVRTQPKDEIKPLPGTEINIGAYFDQRQPTLKAGQSERVVFRSAPYDPNAFRGKRTAVVKIRTTDHKPAQGRNVSVTYFDGHYGAQVVYSGAVPASGDIVLTGLTDKRPSSIPFPAYSVSVDNRRLGSFGFADDPLTQTFEFFLAPGVGDMAPDLELTSLAGGKAVRLSDLRGKVVFLELWATWCGPCQQPMAKLNTLGEEQRDAWKDRVVLLPVSIDSDPVKVRSHTQQRGWTGLEHFWSGEGRGSDFDAPAARAFVASFVPEAVLIGPAGRILWRGHPLDKSDGNDLKARIEGALK